MRLFPVLVVVASLAGSGCGDAPTDPPTRARAERGEGEVDGVLAFADGLRLIRRAATPARATPGGEVQLTWTAEGRTSGPLRFGLLPPRAAARQEVRYGPDGPAEPDLRILWTDGDISDGAVTLTLPGLWHPETAVIWVYPLDGDSMVPATAGPRTAAGPGVFALLEVATRPTRITAAPADAITVDGALQESAWGQEPSILTGSLDGEPVEGAPTRAWVAWDETNLYVAGDLEDEDVWGTHTRRDEPLWEEEAFEVFVAADGSGNGYLELQVSPRNVVFDARFERYRKGEPTWNSTMATGVVVNGDLENRKDRDRGWTVEMAIPWSEICQHTAVTCPPRSGQQLRMNIFRFERPARGGPIAVSLSPTREPDFHAWANAAEVVLGP